MAYGIVLVFDGVGEDQYWSVNSELGVNRDGTGDWPEGLTSHTGGATGSGWMVAEVWTSKEAQQAFMGSRLGAALATVGLPEPSMVLESDIVNYQTPG